MTSHADDIAVDILVVGGGPAGLAAAAIFQGAGLSTLCVDRAAPAPANTPGADLRTAALLTPSVDALDAAGAWDALAGVAAPLWVMRLVDAGGEAPEIRRRADFEAAEMQDRPFGWNLPNATITAALAAHLGSALRAPAALTRLTLRSAEAIAWLSDGARVRAQLVVAADGRDGDTRALAGIAARRWGYGQKALVFAVSHPLPHDGVSTEIHRTGGPFTLVPLPDRDGVHRSSVVWMDTGPNVHGLAELDDDAFSAAATARSCGVLGPLTLASQRGMWPIISQLAERLDGPRVALMGEAAHVVPPIGAQGLNMSIADAAMLAKIASEARAKGEDIGAPATLTRYHRARWPEMAARVAGIDALNRAALAETQPLRDLRAMGLSAIYGLAPVRRAVMKMGMGAGG
ncbi:MAG: 2-octaprenyl-6-methoxyphenol hydroxylase [Paracoccaceae bacterium]|jgi:2-octaprenyl-6-methoxyphenol hydroxylase